MFGFQLLGAMLPVHSSTSIPVCIYIRVNAFSLALAVAYAVLDFFPKLQNVRKDFTHKP